MGFQIATPNAAWKKLIFWATLQPAWICLITYFLQVEKFDQINH